jgi:hypothetical protein
MIVPSISSPRSSASTARPRLAPQGEQRCIVGVEGPQSGLVAVDQKARLVDVDDIRRADLDAQLVVLRTASPRKAFGRLPGRRRRQVRPWTSSKRWAIF